MTVATEPDQQFPASYGQQRLWFVCQLDPGAETLREQVAHVLGLPQRESALAGGNDDSVRHAGMLAGGCGIGGCNPGWSFPAKADSGSRSRYECR